MGNFARFLEMLNEKQKVWVVLDVRLDYVYGLFFSYRDAEYFCTGWEDRYKIRPLRLVKAGGEQDG